jgi:succinate dehydrogenase / fumarate reductase flavoprotein subunit
MAKFDAKIPEGPLALKWTKYKASMKLVNPANKKKIEIRWNGIIRSCCCIVAR